MPLIYGAVTEISNGPDGRITIEATISGEDVLAFLPGRKVCVHLHCGSLDAELAATQGAVLDVKP